MKTLLKFIGLFDQQDNVHGVELKEGLNLITGKSSTGKSSLIEIFDFCMASSEDTIPHGVIKDHASLFFLWITINKADYLLGRDATGKEFYIVGNPEVEDVWKLQSAVFDGNDFGKEEYKIQLGLLFGIDATNTAETAEQMKDKRKGAQRPSIRNMMPFILQHQNLVANKQALFYRFDQKEKRDETIAQFKVFAGFVNAQYYALSVEVSTLKDKIEALKKKMTKAEDDIQETYNKLLDDLSVYTDITGKELLMDLTPEKFQKNPEHFKEEIDKLDYFDIKIDTNSQAQLQKYRDLEKSENRIMAELREKQIHLEEIISSIEYVETYKDALAQTQRPNDLTLNYSVCPFCHLHEERLKLNEEISDLKNQLEGIDRSKAELDEIIVELKRNYSLQKQAYKTIYRISSRIELASNEALKELKGKIDAMTDDLYEKQIEVSKYEVKGKMILAERAIRQAMAKYRKDIPFESSLDDYNLIFDLSNFELYVSKGDNDYDEKKYLRAIGSGANWLNAHLCLFLALADFFYDQMKSTIPSLLFLDQPSQVYFPAQKDKGESFKPEEESLHEADDDLAAVNNVFSLLYGFCKDHHNEYQIIVTDHADDLTIRGLDNFKSIVRARWRKSGEGLVDLRKIKG